ncbi:pilus assembly protein TadG-related protein [Corticibacter populi]|nr:pilus assembly protein TadG-related protein [Corticibacter populi]
MKSMHQLRRSADAQRGQVLVWFLAFSVVLALVFAGVYSVGQATSEKQKVVNAADAAAYSGALTQARALNIAAYTNRAVIANEVLIAQAVSLDSWTHYFERATRSYEQEFKALSAIPYVGVVFRALSVIMQAMNKLAQVQEKALDVAVPGLIYAWEGLYAGWYTGVVSPAFAAPVMASASNSAAKTVLAQSVATQDGRSDAAPHMINVAPLWARNEMAWQGFTKLYRKNGSGAGNSGDGRKIAAEMILESRDRFSKERPGSDVAILDSFFGNSSMCIPFTLKVGSEKKGDTRLVNYDRWEAQDTVELKVKMGPTFCSWGKGVVAVPQGWGRAVANQTQTRGTRQSGKAAALAYQDTHQMAGYSGIKSIWDVDRDASGRPRNEELTYAVAVAKGGEGRAGEIRDSHALGFMDREMTGPLGSPDLKPGYENDQIAAIAEARIFFERPVRNSLDITAASLFRADGNKEYASLYNPYWQVRLSSPTATTKALVYSTTGINPALVVFSQ